MKANRALRRAAIAESRKRGSWEWQSLYIDPRLLAEFPAVRNVRAAVRNDFYLVQIYDVATSLGEVVHLAIRSVAGAGTKHGTEPPWRDMQRIKADLVGHEREAVQVYPRDSDVMDQVDMYHLFVLPAGWSLPFGLHRESGFAHSVQETEMGHG